MTDFLFLVPIALGLGLAGLGAFMWALSSGQYDDLDGAAERILFDEDKPLRDHHNASSVHHSAYGDHVARGLGLPDRRSHRLANEGTPSRWGPKF